MFRIATQLRGQGRHARICEPALRVPLVDEVGVTRKRERDGTLSRAPCCGRR